MSGNYMVTDEIMESVNFVENMAAQDLSTILKLAYEHFEQEIEEMDFCLDDLVLKKHNGDNASAYRDYYKIDSFKDVLAHIKLLSISFNEQDNNEEHLNIWTCFWFEVPWEVEHGFQVEYKNCTLINLDN